MRDIFASHTLLDLTGLVVSVTAISRHTLSLEIGHKMQYYGMFSSSSILKTFGFCSIILHNGINHHAKILAKSGHSSFWILASRGKKKSHKEALMRAINSAFWMKLNITLKILGFCIPSFQSSCILGN
jgi:hypothetical protein